MLDKDDMKDDLTRASELAKEKLAEVHEGIDTDFRKIIRDMTPTGNSTESQTRSKYRDPFSPDIQVTKAKAGFSSQENIDHLMPDVQITPPQSSANQNRAVSTKQSVRPATNIDLASIDESNILDLPFIDAHSFDIPAMLQLSPKDPGTRFRWVNYKNYEGGNYAFFKAIGFSNAAPQDVKGEVSEHLIKSEDGTIKWFDVMLMKIPVLILMGIYKKNQIRALEMVGRWQPTAIAQARRTLQNEIGSDVLEALRKQGKNVEFYAPNQSEMKDMFPEDGRNVNV
jgi:hypothetical protein